MEYRRTNEITHIDWTQVFRAYEARFDCTIDGAIDERGEFWQNNRGTIGRRFGACTVYFKNSIFGTEMFRDQLLSDLGITLGYEEVE